MFGIGRRKSQSALVKSELGESLGHLRQAANHAAYGVGATMGPRVQTARGYVAPTAAKVRDTASTGWSSTMTTLAPLAVAAAGGARQAGSAARKAKSKNMMIQNRKKKQAARRRSSMMTGLLAAGAVAGIAGAMAMRRRRDQQQWEEYDPSRSLASVRDEADTIVVTTPTESARPAAGVTTDRLQGSAQKLGEDAPAKTGAATDSAKQAAQATGKGDGVIGGTPAGTMGTTSGNSRL